MNTPTQTPQQDLIGSDTRLKVGQIWMVQDRVRWYPAEVIGFVRDRVQIRALCPRRVTATPTLAKRHYFNNRPKDGYWLLQEAAC